MSEDVIIDGLPYPIVIAHDAARTLPALLAGRCTSVVLIYDRRIEARARTIGAALSKGGTSVRAQMPLAADDTTKSSKTVASIYEALLECGADRATLVVAVGGGTITDVAGFAASTYLRGVRWAAVPTTVLGMADAAIGGKTGIDLPQGKNLVGSFWPPQAVVADLASLATLPAPDRSTGLAEAIKCAIIGDPPLLDAVALLTSDAQPQRWRDVVAAAARLKVRVVASDPLELGERAVLNLGHTVGHAIEAVKQYRIAHGDAVSIGLRAAGLLAQSLGLWPAGDHRRVLGALSAAGLPLHLDGSNPDALMAAMARDKKSIDGRIRFVVPVRIGEVRYGVDIDPRAVRAAVSACLSAPPGSEWA